MTYTLYQQRIIADAQRERAEKERQEARERAEHEKRKAETEERTQKMYQQQEAATQSRIEANIDAQLAARKQAQRHAWLAAHPSKTDADFEAIWREHLRPLSLAELEADAQRRTRKTLLKSGIYRPF